MIFRATPSIFALLIALLIPLGCSSGDETVAPVNNAPTMTLLFTKLGVIRGIPIDIAVAVDDLDEDPLTLTWSITRDPNGTALTPQNPAKTVMRWQPPLTVGTDTLTVRVSDGQLSKSVTAVIKVGYAASGQTALSLYEKAKSPYIVSPSPSDPIFSIPEGQTTVIEAGTELLIDVPGTTIDVAGGTLIASGTSGEPVVIRPNDRTFQCQDERGWWEGIRGSTFSDGINTYDGTIQLDYTEIRYGQNAVRLNDNAHAVLNHCMIRCSGEAGALMEGNGSLEAFDSEVSNGRIDGIVIAAITSLPDSVVVRGCDIRVNAGTGIRMDIDDSGQTVPISIEYNRLEFNFLRGISLANAVFPQIHFNHFSGNGVTSGVLHIYLENGYPSGVSMPVLNARCNYWGAPVTNQSTIEGTIRDSLDSGSVGTRVDVNPWLNASPITTPPTCTP
jgi:hypothetical protein